MGQVAADNMNTEQRGDHNTKRPSESKGCERDCEEERDVNPDDENHAFPKTHRKYVGGLTPELACRRIHKMQRRSRCYHSSPVWLNDR